MNFPISRIRPMLFFLVGVISVAVLSGFLIADLKSKAAEKQLNKQRTDIINDYLDKHIGQDSSTGEIERESLRKILIMTSYACKVCPSKVFEVLDELGKQRQKEYLIISTPDNKFLADKDYDYIIDESYAIEQHNFENEGGFSVVDIAEEEVVNCQTVNFQLKDELIAALN